jgi:hypothetical protein
LIKDKNNHLENNRVFERSVSMKNRNKIRRASRRLRYLLIAIACLLPLINALMWSIVNSLPEDITSRMLPHFANLPLPLQARALGFATAMIPTGVAIFGLFYLMRLFELYEKGQIFGSANVRCFRNLSRVLIVWSGVGIVYRALLGVVLTLHHPPGQRILSLSFGSPDLTALLLGGILAVIAWVMEEGQQLQEDQELTV